MFLNSLSLASGRQSESKPCWVLCVILCNNLLKSDAQARNVTNPVQLANNQCDKVL